MKPIVFHSEAEQEYDDAAARYEHEREGLGAEFRAEAERILGFIQLHPKIGTPYRKAGVRYTVLDRFPFVIYYREFDQFIWVVAFAHGARRQGYWRNRQVE